MSEKRNATKRGFTLVELLVVIVVIGIVAAVAVIAYNGINGRANDAMTSTDVNNFLKQMANYRTLNGKEMPTYELFAGKPDRFQRIVANARITPENAWRVGKEAVPVSGDEFKDTYGITLGDRVTYMTFTIGASYCSGVIGTSSHGCWHYRGAAAFGVFKNKNAIPASNRIPMIGEDTTNVSGWYMISDGNSYYHGEDTTDYIYVEVKDGQLRCKSGGTPSMSAQKWHDSWHSTRLPTPRYLSKSDENPIVDSVPGLQIRYVRARCSEGTNNVYVLIYHYNDGKSHTGVYPLDTSAVRVFRKELW